MLNILGYKIKTQHALIAVLLLGAILRFWGLSSAEFYHDEGFLAFRSIGYLDYIQNDAQTTPIQWFGKLTTSGSEQKLPWWTNLSFHDHPPLFFLIQNIFFKLFGVSLFVARLPSVIAGILSIYLVYLFSKKIFGIENKLIIFFAPLLLSVASIHIWISRSSLQESVQIFFIILNNLYFFKLIGGRCKTADDNRKMQVNWILFGVTLGLAFLTKYTSFYLLPVYISYILIFRRDFFKSRELYLALLLTLVLFSPVLIYNFYLYGAVGHFDLQFSYLFKQYAPEWQALLGKINDPFSKIVPNLTLMYSLPFLLAAISGIVYVIYEIYRLIFISDFRANPLTPLDKRVLSDGASSCQFNSIFWLLNIIFITLMLTAVGSAFRFIALYTVPVIMFIAILLDHFSLRFSKEVIFKFAIATFFIYELFFGSDILLAFPDFGIVALDRYFDSEFGNTRSLAMPVSSNPHLDRIIKTNAARIPVGDRPFLIIYDENISLSPRLWLFTRRNYYGGIPALTTDQFKKFLNERGVEGFFGYNLYFVKASGQTYLNPLYSNASAQEFEDFLKNELTLTPAKSIYGHDSLLMFSVYKFSL